MYEAAMLYVMVEDHIVERVRFRERIGCAFSRPRPRSFAYQSDPSPRRNTPGMTDCTKCATTGSREAI